MFQVDPSREAEGVAFNSQLHTETASRRIRQALALRSPLRPCMGASSRVHRVSRVDRQFHRRRQYAVSNRDHRRIFASRSRRRNRHSDDRCRDSTGSGRRCRRPAEMGANHFRDGLDMLADGGGLRERSCGCAESCASNSDAARRRMIFGRTVRDCMPIAPLEEREKAEMPSYCLLVGIRH